MADITDGQIKPRASQTSVLKAVRSRICTKYEKVFEEGGNRVVYLKKKPDEKKTKDFDTASISPSIDGFFKDYAEAISYNEDKRLKGGKAPPQIVNIVPSLTICNVQPKQRKQVAPELVITSSLRPHIVHVNIENTTDNPNWERHAKCLYMASLKFPRKMNRGTQTLYRESSAQTLPYLPGVSNDKETLEKLELFKLPKILKGDGPPGVYEVEILERARKRWAFEKAIKKEFECKMKAARSQLERKKQISKHKDVLAAFEWEHWLQREEDIQAYQMMRFDLVLRIFEKREREMHEKSNIRIERSCEQIAIKRNIALFKNDTEYGREMRRLKVKHERKGRNWRKDKISDQLGDPTSEYYAPQMRHGVNPNRRHFQLSRKAFEMRMEDLEKRAVNMKKLECPFAKLKQWSKPKEYKKEVEQNFCTDTNLKKLYESLKGLREQSKKQKIIPKCLKEKIPKEPVVEEVNEDEVTIEEFEFEVEDIGSVQMDDESVQAGTSFSQNSLIEMFSQRDSNNLNLTDLLDERRHEELENMLAEYEGTKIGWLMRFLSEEMDRLQEQRKLHFITMLAQKERWRREAAEAGLRQKENEMRRIYEEIFDETDKANADVCEQYLDNILGIDTHEQADFKAINSIKKLARVIDADLQRWLSSFKLIQHPLNYDSLRCLLRDLVFPDNIAECLLREYEANSIVDYIINDVLFPNIFTLLEPFDVVSPLTNNMVDRLIDNDLYIFSSECSSSCDCYGVCECGTPELEAKAIMRKLIRYATPGRRWRTSTERIADETVKDIINDVCKGYETSKRCQYIPGARRRRPTITRIPSAHDLFKTASELDLPSTSQSTVEESSHTDAVTVFNYSKEKRRHDSVTRSLSSRRVKSKSFTKTDTNVSGSILIDYKQLEAATETSSEVFRPSFLKKISSALDVREDHPYMPQEKEETDETTSSDNEFERITRTVRSDLPIVDTFYKDIINDIVDGFMPSEPEMEPAYSQASGAASSTGKSVTKFILDKIASHMAYEDYDEGDGESTYADTEKTVKFDDLDYADMSEQEDEIDKKASVLKQEHRMVMYEGELKKILQDDDECKCQMEIDYKNHIKELYESGKITIIYKEPRPSMQDVASAAVSLSEMVFEYETSIEGKFVQHADNIMTEEEKSVDDFIEFAEYEGEGEGEHEMEVLEKMVKEQLATEVEPEVAPQEQIPEEGAEQTAEATDQQPKTTEDVADNVGEAAAAPIEEPVADQPQDLVEPEAPIEMTVEEQGGGIGTVEEAPAEEPAVTPAEAPVEEPTTEAAETPVEPPPEVPAETTADENQEAIADGNQEAPADGANEA